MVLQLKRAERRDVYMKLGMSAPSGGGKTASSLILSYGLLKEKYPDLTDKEIWEKIAIVDTENGSGELYVNSIIDGFRIGQYNAITLTPPFSTNKYVEALNVCVQAGMEVAILDSISHAWAGEGGLLEKQGNVAKRTGNSYTAWNEVTPDHNAFVAAMMQSPIHIIATMRSRQEYVQEKDDRGKSTVRKLGLAPVQRAGTEYEFTVFFELDQGHVAFGSKDRTGLFDGEYFTITTDTGKKIMEWLMTSVSTPVEVILEQKAPETHPANSQTALKELHSKIVTLAKNLGGRKDEELMEIVHKYAPTGNTNSIKDKGKALNLYFELEDLKAMREKKADVVTEVPEVPEEEAEPEPA